MPYLKTIGLDLRFLNNDDYSIFVINIIQNLIKNTPDFFYNIYTQKNINLLFKNSKKKIISIKPGSIKEQFSFSKILNNDKNDLVIFFNYKKPINYKKNHIIFLKNLSNLHFPDHVSQIHSFFQNKLFNLNIKNAGKIIVFDKYSKEELNDKLNINEQKIKVLNAFFINKEIQKDENLVDLRVKYNITGDFFIYSSSNGNEKNLDVLIQVFKKIDDINLIILNDITAKNIYFRKKILENNLIKKIHFIGNVNNTEKDFFYKNSLGIFFFDLYSSFPFCFNDAINYNKLIISSNLKILKDIFNNNLIFINQNNPGDIIEKISNFKKTKIEYKKILNEHNISDFTKDLINLIK